MLAIFYFLLEGIGNTLLVTFTCFLSAFLFGLTVAVLRRLSPLPLQKILDVLVFILREFQYLLLFFLFILDCHRLAYMFHLWWP
ncbi:polar amino acid ABC transporter ATP-binding protein [Salmonella enterica]|nr:polar amino acid ABC transporter ATP-binding protein [Salmonella enterica]